MQILMRVVIIYSPNYDSFVRSDFLMSVITRGIGTTVNLNIDICVGPWSARLILCKL